MPLGSPLGANMAPFWLPKSSQILPKIDPKMHQFFDRFLHRFFIDFCSFLEANLGPCWPHFRSKWGDLVARRPLFCWVYVIFRFLAVLAPSWRHLGSIWEGLRLDFGRFLGSILEVSDDNLGIRLLLENLRLLLENLLLQFRFLRENLLFRSILLASGSGWAGGVTRSAKNLLCSSQIIRRVNWS